MSEFEKTKSTAAADANAKAGADAKEAASTEQASAAATAADTAAPAATPETLAKATQEAGVEASELKKIADEAADANKEAAEEAVLADMLKQMGKIDPDAPPGSAEDNGASDSKAAASAPAAAAATSAATSTPTAVPATAAAAAAPAPKEELKLIFESHVSDVLFTDPQFKIPGPILDALTLDMKKERPFKIQASTLPYILKGRNVIAQAQAGAGKTIAFVIGMLSRVDPSLNKLQAVCLSPTRELANQIVSDAITPLMQRMSPPVRTELAVKGVTFARGSRSGAHIMVGTPGKMGECLLKRYISLQHVACFVLDEADFMVAQTAEGRSMGSDTMKVIEGLPSNCQLMFFSATYTDEIFAKARQLVPRAVTFKLASDEDLMMTKIFKVVIDVSKAGGKMKVLGEIYKKLAMQQSIVFCERTAEASSVADLMNRRGMEVSCLHGELQGTDRDIVMQRFRDQNSRVLITTNVLARGVDVPTVAAVINFDLPYDFHAMRKTGGGGHGGPAGGLIPDCETFVHRIGRTGRGDMPGTAITFYENTAELSCIRDIDFFYSAANQSARKAAQAAGGGAEAIAAALAKTNASNTPFESMFTFWDGNDIGGLVMEIERRQAEFDARERT